MGYKIVYNRKKQLRKKVFMRQLWLTVAFFLLFVFCIHKSWPEGAAMLRSLLIPEAVETFVQQLQEGGDIGEAVDAFCQELIYGE